MTRCWAAEQRPRTIRKPSRRTRKRSPPPRRKSRWRRRRCKTSPPPPKIGGDAATEAAAQEQELQTAITGVKEEINALVTAYTEAYDAALESISGQYQLWDEAAGVVATSAGTINSALESQITYWQDYNANLQTLTERSADIEGLSEMIASFADGSEESVNAIAGMAGATDEQLATMVANWQTLQTEQEAAAGSVADLKTDFTATMDELQAELAADIEAMDLGTEAAESGKATIQGFVSGAEAMLPQVQAAYSRIAQAAIDAIDAKLEIHSPSRVMEEKADMTWAGYIKETEALQPDVAEAMSGMAGAVSRLSPPRRSRPWASPRSSWRTWPPIRPATPSPRRAERAAGAAPS